MQLTRPQTAGGDADAVHVERQTYRGSRQAVEAVQRRFRELLGDRKRLRVLDAGCGRGTWNWLPFDFGSDAHVVGIDPSADALALNELVDERIVGDIQTHPLPEDEFDVVLCWDVVEHLPEPISALERLARALKANGLLVVKTAYVFSPKALLAKVTPLRFHVWVYRHVFRFRAAGTKGYGPYRTYLSFSLAPAALKRFADAHGLEIELLELYGFEKGSAPIKNVLLRFSWRTASFLYRVLTLGKDPNLTELVVILRKPAVPATVPAPA